ncbi:alpha/beta hydrolase [Streptosporangium sp. NBC_01639]|uniref:alpha/beta hydrolase family protein n=1 Tax=Streptosporangium sp. NBC_01639 TaxID=2975948 RepID=UPI003862E78D|nr:alpha/beta hydrolase [Streptosporangium sp. NBC_01639]
MRFPGLGPVLSAVVTALTLTGVAAVPAHAGPVARSATPETTETTEFTTTVHGDAADVYAPAPAKIHHDLPVALLLQGADVDKSRYSAFARAVASYGFAVVVPNHSRVVFGQAGLFAEEAQASWTAAWMQQEDIRAGSPLRGRIDTASLVLLGHSFGGAAGLTLTTGACVPPFCGEPATAPAQLKAAAFYGTNNTPPGGTGSPPVPNAVPVALVQGTADGVASPASAEGTYDALLNPPKMLVSVTGANHYGLTDIQNPPGARPDPVPQTVAQDRSVKAAARWSAMFLRTALGDHWSAVWLYGVGDSVDGDVTVEYVK